MTLCFKKNIFVFLLFIVCFMQGCSDNITPEQKALDLVINSHSANKDVPVHRLVENFIREKGDDVCPSGKRV